jgi:hypothetical protein
VGGHGCVGDVAAKGVVAVLVRAEGRVDGRGRGCARKVRRGAARRLGRRGVAREVRHGRGASGTMRAKARRRCRVWGREQPGREARTQLGSARGQPGRGGQRGEVGRERLAVAAGGGRPDARPREGGRTRPGRGGRRGEGGAGGWEGRGRKHEIASIPYWKP